MIICSTCLNNFTVVKCEQPFVHLKSHSSLSNSMPPHRLLNIEITGEFKDLEDQMAGH